ncbi:MAG: hypothetical protein ABSA67_18925 [Candidatus Brocadiia bacterium]|jgi:hypothetical protein
MAVNLTVDPLFTLLPKESIQVQDAPAGPWRTVDAFVDRLAPDEMLGANMGDRPRFEVEFRNDAVLGVAAGFDRGQTTFCVAQRYGGTPDPTVPASLMHCFKILGQDEGCIQMELR